LVQVRFRGGATRTRQVVVPKPASELFTHEQNTFTLKELAEKLGVSHNTAYIWAKKVILDAELHPARKLYLGTLKPDILRERLTSEYKAGGARPILTTDAAGFSAPPKAR